MVRLSHPAAWCAAVRVATARTRRPPERGEPDRWVYDPLDTRPAEPEREEVDGYVVDQRYALNLMGNGVVYHGEPLAAETVVAGWPELTL